MGNEQGKPNGKLGVSAVATVCTIQDLHVVQMVKYFRSLAKGDLIKREDLNNIMEKLEDIENVDKELLSSMFTMFDVKGDNNIPYKEFLAGVCLLITGSEKDKLSLALSVTDTKNTGNMSRTDLRKTLTAMKNVVSYFGDPVVRDVELNMIVTELFKRQPSSSSTIPYKDNFDSILEHNITQSFLLGKGKARFGKGVE